jgi:polar amino acid transport system substrate-binding protein
MNEPIRPAKRTIGLLVSLLALFTQAPCGAQLQQQPQSKQQSLHLVANSWEPLTGRALPRGGLATEIVTTALRRAGYAVDIEIEPWARALANVANRKYDGIVAIWSTPGRRKRYDFSDAYYENELVFIKRKDRSLAFNNWHDLDGLIVGTGRDYDYNESFRLARNFTKSPVASLSVNLSKLVAGRIDLTIDDKLIAQYAIRKGAPGFNFERDLDLLVTPLARAPLYFGISLQYAGHAEVVARFNEVLAAMKRDGSYDAIVSRHVLSIIRPQ